MQDFLVPLHADTLFLGFVDGDFFVGDPDFYSDNSGELEVEFSISAVPIPAAAWLFGSALIGLVAIKRRKV